MRDDPWSPSIAGGSSVQPTEKFRGPLRLCAWLQECLHPREAALLAAALLLCCSLVLTSFCGSPDDELDDLQHWAQHPWERVDCRIKDVGISYVGDCSNESFATMKTLHPRPVYNYSDCVSPPMPKGCSSTVKHTFSSGRRLGHVEQQQQQHAAVHDHADSRRNQRQRSFARGRILKEQFTELCHDRFALWAAVNVGDHASVCGYRTGLLGHSTYTKWDEVLKDQGAITAGSSQTCWLFTLKSVGLLRMHVCNIVALEDPKRWPEAADKWVQQQLSTQRQLLGLGVSLLFLGIVAAGIHHWCWSSRVERWDDLVLGCEGCFRQGWWLYGRPGPPEAESERVRFVRERWRFFRANVLAEYQPVGSAREYPGGLAHGT